MATAASALGLAPPSNFRKPPWLDLVQQFSLRENVPQENLVISALHIRRIVRERLLRPFTRGGSKRFACQTVTCADAEGQVSLEVERTWRRIISKVQHAGQTRSDRVAVYDSRAGASHLLFLKSTVFFVFLFCFWCDEQPRLERFRTGTSSSLGTRRYTAGFVQRYVLFRNLHHPGSA